MDGRSHAEAYLQALPAGVKGMIQQLPGIEVPLKALL